MATQNQRLLFFEILYSNMHFEKILRTLENDLGTLYQKTGLTFILNLEFYYFWRKMVKMVIIQRPNIRFIEDTEQTTSLSFLCGAHPRFFSFSVVSVFLVFIQCPFDVNSLPPPSPPLLKVRC